MWWYILPYQLGLPFHKINTNQQLLKWSYLSFLYFTGSFLIVHTEVRYSLIYHGLLVIVIPVFSTDFMNGKTVWIVEFTLTGWHVFISMYSCSNIREHLEQWQVNVNVIHNDVFWKTQTKRHKRFLCFYKIFLCAL